MVQKTVLEVVGAVLGAVVGAIAWAVVTDVTNFQIGYMAVGVGWLAGYGMRTLGGAPTITGARVAAVVGLLGCVLGKLMTAGIGIVKHDTSASPAFVATAMLTRPSVDIGILHDSFSVMDLMFYAIAIYTAYRAALVGRRVDISIAAPAATRAAATLVVETPAPVKE